MLQSDALLIFLFLATSLMLLTNLKLMRIDITEPPIVFLAGWLLVAGVLFAHFVAYDAVFSPSSFTLVLVGIVAFISGAITKRIKSAPINYESVQDLSPFLSGTLAFLFAGSLVYLFLQVQEILEFDVGNGIGAVTLVALRESHTENALQGLLDARHVVKGVTRVFAMVLAMSLPIFWHEKRRSLVLLASICLVVLTIESLLHGGRSLVAFIILALFYIAMLLSTAARVMESLEMRIARFKRRLFAVAGMAMFFYLAFVVFPPLRNPDLVDNVDFFLNVLHESQTSDWVYSISQRPGFGWVALVAYGTAYLSQPIVKLTFFLRESDIETWYTLGAYNFPYLSKVWAAVTGGVDNWVTIRRDIALPSEAFGYPINPWASILRDFVIDFGLPGSAIAVFCFGYLAQSAYNALFRCATAEALLLAGLFGPICFVSAFFSPFPIGFVSNTLAVSFSLVVVRWLIATRQAA